jgi:hypothetical protein
MAEARPDRVPNRVSERVSAPAWNPTHRDRILPTFASTRFGEVRRRCRDRTGRVLDGPSSLPTKADRLNDVPIQSIPRIGIRMY